MGLCLQITPPGISEDGVKRPGKVEVGHVSILPVIHDCGKGECCPTEELIQGGGSTCELV